MKGTKKFNAVTWIRQDDTTINIGTINQFPAATQSNESASDNEKFSMSWDMVNSLFQSRHGVCSSNLNSDQVKKFLVHFSQKTYRRTMLNIYRKYITLYSNPFFLSLRPSNNFSEFLDIHSVFPQFNMKLLMLWTATDKIQHSLLCLSCLCYANKHKQSNLFACSSFRTRMHHYTKIFSWWTERRV